MKFRPLHDRVLVKRIEAEEKTVGGIIIPDTAKEKPSETIATGPGGPRRERQADPDRPPGRRPRAVRQVVGHQVKIDGQELLIMKESDVMGVLTNTFAKKKAA